jgi:hypothetical protein
MSTKKRQFQIKDIVHKNKSHLVSIIGYVIDTKYLKYRILGAIIPLLVLTFLGILLIEDHIYLILLIIGYISLYILYKRLVHHKD